MLTLSAALEINRLVSIINSKAVISCSFCCVEKRGMSVKLSILSIQRQAASAKKKRLVYRQYSGRLSAPDPAGKAR
jgi:adenine C2-methylase RlmN of 23S rRNA A2503 and tRNA A37